MSIELIDALKKVNLFEELKHNDIVTIANQFEPEYYPINAIIVNQGDYGDKVYFIIEGSVEIFIIDKEGKENVLTILNSGNYFGELAILIDGFRNSSARAKTVCHIVSLTKLKFNAILDEYASVSRALNKVLSHRLGETLHLVSAKKENTLILLIVEKDNENHLNHFMNYFFKLSEKPIIFLDENISKEDFIKKYNETENHYFFIKSYHSIPEFLALKIHHIINFVEEKKEHICLTSSASHWKIEHIVRTITKKTIGIALCSGGAPGASQLGVLNVLHDEGIPLDYIVGTSVGAVVGGSYAFSQSPEHLIEKFIEMSNQSKLISMANLMKHISFQFSGFLKNSFYRNVLQSIFDDKLFSDASIPFAAIASDLYTGKTIVLKDGKVIDAIIASNTAPVLFEPYVAGKNLLIDGVATNPLPVDVLISENIHIKIAVPIPQLDLAVSMSNKAKLTAVYIRSRSMMAERMTEGSSALADVIIKPAVKELNMNDWQNLNLIIEAGRDAAHTAIKRIRYLLYGSKDKP